MDEPPRSWWEIPRVQPGPASFVAGAANDCSLAIAEKLGGARTARTGADGRDPSAWPDRMLLPALGPTRVTMAARGDGCKRLGRCAVLFPDAPDPLSRPGCLSRRMDQPVRNCHPYLCGDARGPVRKCESCSAYLLFSLSSL